LGHKYGMNVQFNTLNAMEDFSLSESTKNHIEVTVNLSNQTTTTTTTTTTNILMHLELKISQNAQPGAFCEHFTIQHKISKQSISVFLSGKILRKEQGTPLLHHGVHMSGIVVEENNND